MRDRERNDDEQVRVTRPALNDDGLYADNPGPPPLVSSLGNAAVQRLLHKTRDAKSVTVAREAGPDVDQNLNSTIAGMWDAGVISPVMAATDAWESGTLEGMKMAYDHLASAELVIQSVMSSHPDEGIRWESKGLNESINYVQTLIRPHIGLVMGREDISLVIKSTLANAKFVSQALAAVGSPAYQIEQMWEPWASSGSREGGE